MRSWLRDFARALPAAGLLFLTACETTRWPIVLAAGPTGMAQCCAAAVAAGGECEKACCQRACAAGEICAQCAREPTTQDVDEYDLPDDDK